MVPKGLGKTNRNQLYSFDSYRPCDYIHRLSLSLRDTLDIPVAKNENTIVQNKKESQIESL